MSRINETFELDFDGVTVKVENDGIKRFEDQAPQAMEELKAWIAEGLKNGEVKGWTPYANFESSVSWTIKKEDNETNKKK